MSEVMHIAITGYGLKFALSALLTPVLYLLNYFMLNVLHIKPVPLEEDGQ